MELHGPQPQQPAPGTVATPPPPDDLADDLVGQLVATPGNVVVDGSVEIQTATWSLLPDAARGLRDLLETVEASVPFYREHWNAGGARIADLDLPAEFQRLPVVHKTDLRAAGDRLRNTHVSLRSLEAERTSGSTGEPFTMLLDRRTRVRRRRRFLSALWRCGYRPGQRVMMMTSRAPSLVKRAIGWTCVDFRLKEDELLEAYRNTRPDVVYGPLSSLISLARSIRRTGTPHAPTLIVSTAERLDASQRAELARLCPAIGDFYGCTELGLIAVRAPQDERFHLVPGLLAEYAPEPHQPEVRRLILTDLLNSALPLVRYDTGDRVRGVVAGPDGGFECVDGREVDFIRLPDGRLLSPYRFTMAIEPIEGILRYEIVQQPGLELEVNVWTASRDPAVLAAAQAAVSGACEGKLAVKAFCRTSIQPTHDGKPRPVRSLAPPP